MLFNSLQFLVFFVCVYSLYLLLKHRWQNRLLIAASCLFYAAWNWKFLILMFVSISTDYFCSQKIHATSDQGRKKQFLLLGLIVNLSILAFFKYFNFFLHSLQTLLAWIFPSAPPALNTTLQILLPVGVSFYTFEAMSYLIDVYKGVTQPAKRYWDYVLFVIYFPHLVAGPIMRAKDFIPQIVNPRVINFDQIRKGSFLILWGLYQKVFIADSLARFVDPVFVNPALYTPQHIWLALYAFAFQIYCDFAGYTNMARGLGRVMGFDITVNFLAPYLSKNPSEFWQRWHISLSSWLRDYLYIPLGGNRLGSWPTFRNILIVMVLGGLWHGANWTFIIWGFYHAVLLITHRLFISLNAVKNFRPPVLLKGINVLIFFHLICIGWLFFRAPSIDQAQFMLNALFSSFALPDWDMLSNIVPYLYLLFVMDFIEYRHGSIFAVFKIKKIYQIIIYTVIAVSLLLTSIDIRESTQRGEITGPKQFIYFQF